MTRRDGEVTMAQPLIRPLILTGLVLGLVITPWRHKLPVENPAETTEAPVRSVLPQRTIWPVRPPPGTPDTARAPEAEPASPAAALGALLASGDYGPAVAMFERLYDLSTSEQAERYRNQLVAYAGGLIQRGQPTASIDLLESYASVFYRDPDALLMLGRAYRAAGAYPQAIDALQQAVLYNHDPGARSLIEDQLNWVVSLYTQRLRDEGRRDAVIGVYQGLIEADPGNPYYKVGLARVLIDFEQYDAAERTLRAVANDGYVWRQARQLLRDIGMRRGSSS